MNYTELVAAGKAYADRKDVEVVENLPVFIQMAEGKINRRLRTRKQSARAAIPTKDGEEFYSLPPDFAGMRHIQFDSSSVDGQNSVYIMEYAAPEFFDQERSKVPSGKHYYTIIANQLQVYPRFAAGFFIEIIYYQRVPPLTNQADSNTNWLSEDYPDIYLSGLVAEIELFAKNYDVAGLWADRMNTAIDDLENIDIGERWSGGSLTTRIMES